MLRYMDYLRLNLKLLPQKHRRVLYVVHYLITFATYAPVCSLTRTVYRDARLDVSRIVSMRALII